MMANGQREKERKNLVPMSQKYDYNYNTLLFYRHCSPFFFRDLDNERKIFQSNRRIRDKRYNNKMNKQQ